MAIIPIDPITGFGWKIMDISQLENASKSELRDGLEARSYMYDEIMLESRHNVSNLTLLSTSGNGLVQILQTASQDFTFSALTSQSFLLNNYPQYFIVFFDPTFAVISGNPDTIPRTFVPLPSSAGRVYIYLRVRTELLQSDQHFLS